MTQHWFERMKGIQEKIKEYQSNSFLKAEPMLQDILEQRLVQLRMLRDQIMTKEKNFFGSLNVTARFKDDPKLALSVLNAKVREWNQSGAQQMIANNSIQTVLDILTNKGYRSLSIEELDYIVEDFVNNEESFSVDAINDITGRLMEELNNALVEDAQSGNKKTVQKLSKKSRAGQDYIYFTITQKEGKWDISINSSLKPELKSRLKRAFKLLIEQYGKSTAAFSDAKRNANLVQQVILNKVNNAQVRDCLRRELTPGRIEKYNLAKDFNVIKGFLGEVYWSAFFSYLGANTEPTGDIKDELSGASIGVDLLVNNFGFQVKNFNFKKDGTISFGTRGNYKQAGTFIKDRAGIDGNLGELMLNLYGSYAYNIDVSDGEFTNTRQGLEKVLTIDAEEVFTYYIDKIIRVDTDQQNQVMRETEGMIPESGLMVNTFFVIGDKIIPSSAILTEIIDTIEFGKNNPLIDFQITSLMAKEDSPKYDKKVDWIPYKMANYTGISYNIDLNIESILEKAYKNAFE